MSFASYDPPQDPAEDILDDMEQAKLEDWEQEMLEEEAWDELKLHRHYVTEWPGGIDEEGTAPLPS